MATRKEGAVFEIILPGGKFSYGRVLAKADYAFYDIYSDQKITDLNNILKKEILFIIAVYKSAITKGRWKKIGVKDIEPELQKLPLKFIQDELSPDSFQLYDPITGQMTPALKNECAGLERAAVWEPQQVEERIVDHYAGRPNNWVEDMRLK